MAASFRRRGTAAASWLAVGVLAACADNSPTALRGTEPATARFSVAGNGDVVPLITGDVIVRVKEGVDHAALEAQYGLTHKESMLLARAEVMTAAPGTELETARALAADPRVEFAQANYLTVLDPCTAGLCMTPRVDALAAYTGTNDSFRGYKWDLDNDGATRVGNKTAIFTLTGKPDADIDWMEMYEALGPAYTGTATIGILDTGIRDTHQDLAGRVVKAMNFATGYPADFVTDRIGHGTHVSGIAAAKGNNSLGVMGVAYAPNIKLINAKVCENYIFPDGVTRSSCPSASTANAIVWATDNGANVLNMSLGGSPTAVSGDPAQEASLAYARSKNVLPFCATGNDGVLTSIAFPARFTNCVAVASTDWGDKRASYSNASPDVDIAAPGGTSVDPTYGSSYILSSYNRSDADYVFLTGTSMATPQAAGLAAMLYASGMTSADDVLARMQNTADDLGPAGKDSEFGAGRINAYRALTGNSAPLPPTAKISGPYTIAEGQTITFSSAGSASNAGGSITGWRWQVGAAVAGVDGSSTFTRTFAQNTAAPTPVFLTVKETNGQTGATGTMVTVVNAAPFISTILLDFPVLNRPTAGRTFNMGFRWSDAGTQDNPWTYTIDWADGTFTTGTKTDQSQVNASHVFAKAGDYSVKMYIKDKDGAQAGKTALVQVQPAP